jgi:hypothetical protein
MATFPQVSGLMDPHAWQMRGQNRNRRAARAALGASHGTLVANP